MLLEPSLTDLDVPNRRYNLSGRRLFYLNINIPWLRGNGSQQHSGVIHPDVHLQWSCTFDLYCITDFPGFEHPS